MVSHRGGYQLVNESPAERRARGGGSSRLPEESRWERRLPPLQRARARPRSGRPRPPRVTFNTNPRRPPGCRGKAGRRATPLQPAETRRRQLPIEDRVLVASVRECLVPCHSICSSKNHRRSISIDVLYLILILIEVKLS